MFLFLRGCPEYFPELCARPRGKRLEVVMGIGVDVMDRAF